MEVIIKEERCKDVYTAKNAGMYFTLFGNAEYKTFR
jgi:hypothetical protein